MRRSSGTVYSWRAEFGDAFAERKVLVTGATGFIGWHLCEALVTLGAEMHGLSLDACVENLVRGCAAWAVDLTDIEAVRMTVSNIQPQLVFHLAGMVTARQDLSLVLPMLWNNLVSTVHLLLVAAEVGCQRIVVVGSSEEPTDGAPTSPYAAAKAAASMYGQMFHKVYGLPVVVVRPFMTYGPRQESTKLIPYTILALLRGENPHLSSGRRVCDFVYVVDVARGLLKVGIQPGLEGETVNLGTGGGTTVRDVVGLLVELTGSTDRPVFGAVPDRIEEHSHIADRDATQRLLDWEPQWSLRDGLVETIEWYRAIVRDSGGTS
ncbi:MAG: SDR family NAD(P)-dependent oxidoreductase [Chloroflexi bacterium]|nr:SDR family NAD(P)-dependent oxidoreductase [Chloroflexota bacterium]